MMLNRRWPRANSLGRPNRAQRSRQQGFFVIALALIGLLGGAAVAVPVLNRATSGLRAHGAESAGEPNGARSAAEHAIWRVRNDVPFLSGFSGTPSANTYDIDWDGTLASVDIEASSARPPNRGMQVFMVTTPEVIPINQPTVITMTMTIINHDYEPHQISRITADPLLWDPAYITGSTTGITTADPSSCTPLFGCRWNLFPYYTIPAHGGQATISFSFLGNQNWGTWWTYASARVESVGTIAAPLTARSRFMDLDDLHVSTTATVLDPLEGTTTEMVAGIPNQVEYTIYAWNSGAAPLGLDWIEHWTPTPMDFVSGSATLDGAPLGDPNLVFDWIAGRDLHAWTFDSDVDKINAGQTRVLKFRMTATLLPGVHYVSSHVKVEEDGGFFGLLSSLSAGETAPVTARRMYTIEATHDGHTVTADVIPTPNGVSVLSWIES